jgi:ATPase involved in DNA repair
MRINFKNFKSFKSDHSIDIKPLTILIGKNNAGKSTISELINYFTEFKTPL